MARVWSMRRHAEGNHLGRRDLPTRTPAASWPERRDPEETTGQHELLQPYLRQLVVGGDFPHLAAMLDGGPPGPDDDNFECGLRWLLDGFIQELG